MHVGPAVAAPQLISAINSTESQRRPGDVRSTETRAHAVRAAAPETALANEADRRQIQSLRVRDREVRAHEHAHLAAAGGLAKGGASFQTVKGPDGRLYAVGGEVQIDTSPVAGDPQATVSKAQRIRRAALAPAEPSRQDRRVAARASVMEREARVEIVREDSEALHEVTRPAMEEGGACTVCGGAHSGAEHSASNRQMIEVAIDVSRGSSGRFVGSA